MPKAVVGRFAPSPTGALHLGSLVAATASYLNAKHQQGKWLLRIDDIDTSRVVAGSSDNILYTLAAFGFEWDSLIYQSQRLAHYQAALAQLQAQDHVYVCQCTRKQLANRSSQFPLYDRHCRHTTLTCANNACAYRLKTPLTGIWLWQDVIQGEQQTRWQIDTDDFIIKRRDGILAYHLACAVDDADYGITEVIRGADLLTSTAAQQLIQHLLGKVSPDYGHHALIYEVHTGIKLSKASDAPALDIKAASTALTHVLGFLGQAPPTDLAQAALSDVWQWALSHWDRNKCTPLVK